MFNSQVINSPRANNTTLYNNVNETANGISRSFIQPKITSTPLIRRDSIFATPPKQSLLSPRRYSLSEIATPPRSNRRDFSKVINTGPLLTSTKYDINVSTYEDTKSPGLAGRIVQYNNEMEKEKERLRLPTHQAKYDSPGLFPVVHLFKKKLPELEQRPKRVTIRISSPEYLRHHTQEYNRKLLEGIIKPSSPIDRGSPFSPSNQSGSSTRSVLDALKEISRKRIHANEEYDLNEESGKRLRTMDNGDTNKRPRDDFSPDKSSSPTKPTSKRVCMYDEYAASCSSTDFSFKNVESMPKRKSISISTLTENPKETKQVKLINAETQTVITEPCEKDSKTPETATEEENKEKVSTDEDSVKKKGPLKIFDDAPLERIRKNRLAALMGSLTGKEPVLLPKPDYATLLNSVLDDPDKSDTITPEVPKLAEKPLVSILSSPKKPSPTKSIKHVHFSVPESTSQSNLDSSPVLSSAPSVPSITVSVPSVNETKVTFEASNKATPETPAPPSSPVGLHPCSSDTTNTLPVITFGDGNVSNSSSVASIVSNESSNSLVSMGAPKTSFAIPNFQFKPPAVAPSVPSSVPTSQLSFPSSASLSKPPSATTSPPKMGGFKFDLSKPVVTSNIATSSTVPTFSFGNTTQANAAKTNSDFGKGTLSLPSSQNASPPTFNFKAITPASSSNISFPTGQKFGTTTTTPSLVVPAITASAAPTFKFGSSTTEDKHAATSAGFPLSHSNAITFGTATTTAPPPPPAFGINTSTTSAPATSSTFNTSKAPFFSFGAPKTTSASSGFGVPASTTTSSISFGAPSTTPSSFGTSTSNFLSTSSSLPKSSFGVATTSSAFGSPSTNSSANFGSNVTSMFGGNKALVSFGASTRATPTFGIVSSASSSPFSKSNAPQFGPQNTTQSTFGTPTTTVSFGTSNAFSGATTTTSSSVFGGTNNSVFEAKTGGFGTPSNNTNIFGGQMNTQPPGFGAVSKPAFGSVTTSPFAASTKTTVTPSFGTSSTPSFNFGAKTTASSSFGVSNSFGAITTASSGFGTPSTSSFVSPSSFGGTTNFGTGNTFGGSNTPAFGVATTSTQPSGFGVTNTPSFGTANVIFNSGEKSSVFGNASTFGSNATPFGAPGAPSSTGGFGTSNSTSGFGTNTAAPGFAKPQTTQNTFGVSNTNAFGTSNSFGSVQQQSSSFGSVNPPNTQSGVFNFGASAVPKPPGVFSFGAGASNEVPKPTFNFTAGSSGPPAFGSGAAPSFGSGGSMPFGSSGVPQFNSPQGVSQGMFSIGSGSSTGKTRTHLKPKRRI